MMRKLTPFLPHLSSLLLVCFGFFSSRTVFRCVLCCRYYLGEWLYSHNVTHTVGQVVYQVFVIDCLAKNELDIGQQALMTIASVLPKITSKAIVEWSPFMYSLAERLQSMVKAKAIRVTDDLWKLAVDSILVKAVHCEVEVHRHVLQVR